MHSTFFKTMLYLLNVSILSFFTFQKPMQIELESHSSALMRILLKGETSYHQAHSKEIHASPTKALRCSHSWNIRSWSVRNTCFRIKLAFQLLKNNRKNRKTNLERSTFLSQVIFIFKYSIIRILVFMHKIKSSLDRTKKRKTTHAWMEEIIVKSC